MTHPSSSSARADAQGPLTLEVPEAVSAWAPQIAAAAEEHGLDPDFVALVIWLESRGVAEARSPAGALGLMQMMPATAAAVARRHGQTPPTEPELLDPERNLALGCTHLAELAEQHATEGLDAEAVQRIAIAYNGGPRVLAAWQRGEPLPEETARYSSTMKERWREHLARR